MINHDKYKNLLEETIDKKIALTQEIHKLENKKLTGKDVLLYAGSIALTTTLSLFMFAATSMTLAIILPLLYTISIPAYKTVSKYSKLKEYKKKLSIESIRQRKLEGYLNTMPKFQHQAIEEKEIEKNHNQDAHYNMPYLQLEATNEKKEEKPYVYVKRK